MRNTRSNLKRRGQQAPGFSLIEMMLALGIFGIISAAAFSLMAQHVPLFSQQQSLAAANIAVRNSAAQMQLDIVNAGANWYPGGNIPNWPVGVVVINNPTPSAGDCRTGTPPTYGANCFDAINIITADTSVPLASPGTSAAGCIDLDASGTVYLTPVPPAAPYASAAAATAAAALYNVGDQILFLSGNGGKYTSAKISAISTHNTLPFAVVLTVGTTSTNTYIDNTQTPAVTITTKGYNGPAPSTNDPYNMSTNPINALSSQFCPASDYALRLSPVQYFVDYSNPSDPMLMRQEKTVNGGNPLELADQIIGFKIGVSLFNNSADQGTTAYEFNNNAYVIGTGNVFNNYTLVRSVMVSLIARTTPDYDPSYTFRNTFDQGPYMVQGTSVVINPRNMSMTD